MPKSRTISFLVFWKLTENNVPLGLTMALLPVNVIGIVVLDFGRKWQKKLGSKFDVVYV